MNDRIMEFTIMTLSTKIKESIALSDTDKLVYSELIKIHKKGVVEKLPYPAFSERLGITRRSFLNSIRRINMMGGISVYKTEGKTLTINLHNWDEPTSSLNVFNTIMYDPNSPSLLSWNYESQRGRKVGDHVEVSGKNTVSWNYSGKMYTVNYNARLIWEVYHNKKLDRDEVAFLKDPDLPPTIDNIQVVSNGVYKQILCWKDGTAAVEMNSRTGKYVARIRDNNKRLNLGTFEVKEDAINAYRNALFKIVKDYV